MFNLTSWHATGLLRGSSLESTVFPNVVTEGSIVSNFALKLTDKFTFGLSWP